MNKTTDQAVIAQKQPFVIDVEAGKVYWWCACGRSQKQPFCDGSHSVTNIVPIRFEPQQNQKVFFCGCKQSQKAPLCDGSHSRLS